jgi:hypothetical protein
MSRIRSILKLSTAKIEHRQSCRFPAIGKICIWWQDRRGKTRRQRGRVINMSHTGALVKCGAFIPPGIFVYTHSAPLAIMRGAHIQRCEPLRDIQDRPAIRGAGRAAHMLTWVSQGDPQTEVNRRRGERNRIRCWIRLSYLTQTGTTRSIRGRALNVSSSGALLQILQPIPVDSCVRLVRGNGLLVGTMSVRHCARQNWCYNIGLEFMKPFAYRF